MKKKCKKRFKCINFLFAHPNLQILRKVWKFLRCRTTVRPWLLETLCIWSCCCMWGTCQGRAGTAPTAGDGCSATPSVLVSCLVRRGLVCLAHAGCRWRSLRHGRNWISRLMRIVSPLPWREKNLIGGTKKKQGQKINSSSTFFWWGPKQICEGFQKRS